MLAILLNGCGSGTTSFQEDMFNTEREDYYDIDLDKVDKKELLNYVYTYYEDDIKRYVAENFDMEEIYGQEIVEGE
jgi:hypothetical protein